MAPRAPTEWHGSGPAAQRLWKQRSRAVDCLQGPTWAVWVGGPAPAVAADPSSEG